MFDIGFPELLLVSVIALIVIGPEKLPSTIRTLSLWLGRLRHSLMTIRDEIEAELGAEEIRRQLRDDSALRDVRETKEEIDEMIDSAKREMREIKSSVPFDTIVSPPAGGNAASGAPVTRRLKGSEEASPGKPSDDQGA